MKREQTVLAWFTLQTGREHVDFKRGWPVWQTGPRCKRGLRDPLILQLYVWNLVGPRNEPPQQYFPKQEPNVLAATQATRLAGRAQIAQQSSVSGTLWLAECLGWRRARPPRSRVPLVSRLFFADGFRAGSNSVSLYQAFLHPAVRWGPPGLGGALPLG